MSSSLTIPQKTQKSRTDVVHPRCNLGCKKKYLQFQILSIDVYEIHLFMRVRQQIDGLIDVGEEISVREKWLVYFPYR